MSFCFRRHKERDEVQRNGSMHLRRHGFRRRAQCLLEGSARRFVTAERLEITGKEVTGFLVILSQFTGFAEGGQGALEVTIRHRHQSQCFPGARARRRQADGAL